MRRHLGGKLAVGPTPRRFRRKTGRSGLWFVPVKQSLTQSRVLTPTQLRAPPGGWPLAPRISHADELQLACRLAECQRELLALALHVPESLAELRYIQAELGTGALSIGDVLEYPDSAPGEARRQFDAWVDRAGRSQSEGERLWARQARERREPDAALEAAEQQLHTETECIRSLRISSAVRARLVHAAQAQPQAETARAVSEPAPGLPPQLMQRMRRLDLEIERIRDRFTSANQGLVSHVVQRYIGMGLSRDDLLQEGNIGLMRAIDKFDHRRGNRFGAYAIWWIRQAVRRALANQSRTIRIPVHALGTRYTLDQAARRLALSLGRSPSEQELSHATGVMPASVAQVLSIVREPLSLDAPRGFDTDDRLVDSVADPGATDAAAHTLGKERAEHLRGLLGSLSVREQRILRMRFGLDGMEECTLEQIGQAFALTRERVRQIVAALWPSYIAKPKCTAWSSNRPPNDGLTLRSHSLLILSEARDALPKAGGDVMEGSNMIRAAVVAQAIILGVGLLGFARLRARARMQDRCGLPERQRV